MMILRVLGYLWALPVTLVGFLLWVAGGPKKIRWSEGCIEAIPGRIFGVGSISGQTWGWLILYRDQEAWDRIPLRVHERVHVLHTLILGVLFLPAYGAHFMWNMYALGLGYQDSYLRIWSERYAYRIQAKYTHRKLAERYWGDSPPLTVLVE